MAATDQTQPKRTNDSPPWSRTTKLVVILSTLAILVFCLYFFRGLVRQIVIAAVLAYVLTPLLKYVERHTPIKHTVAVVVTYLLLALITSVLLVAIGFEVASQITQLIRGLPTIIADVTDALINLAQQPIAVGPFTFDLLQIDLGNVRAQIIEVVRSLLGPSGEFIANIASGTVATVSTIAFIFIISIYIAIDMPRFGGLIADLATRPGYRGDAEHLTHQFSRIWRAYLRGQVILGFVIGIVVWASLSLLGVRNALALGLVSGVLEFLPVLGPVIGAIVAVLAALLQTDIPFGMSPVMYALLVLVVMIVIQQIENNILVPRIVGGALDLHPLIVIIGVLAGTSVAGILGAILAAPVLATIKLLGTYGWRKVFDLDPFEGEEPELEPTPLRERIGRMLSRDSDASDQDRSDSPPDDE